MIEYTVDRLNDVGHQRKHLARLKDDLSENGRLQRCDLPSMTPHMEEQLNSLTTKYVDALKENIQNRFDGNLKVLTTFKVFDPTVVPKRSKAGYKQYGVADVGLQETSSIKIRRIRIQRKMSSYVSGQSSSTIF